MQREDRYVSLAVRTKHSGGQGFDIKWYKVQKYIALLASADLLPYFDVSPGRISCLLSVGCRPCQICGSHIPKSSSVRVACRER
jgi:hypothetical protein